MGQTFACKIDANAADTNTTNQPYNKSPVTSWRKFRIRNIVLTFDTIPIGLVDERVSDMLTPLIVVGN